MVIHIKYGPHLVPEEIDVPLSLCVVLSLNPLGDSNFHHSSGNTGGPKCLNVNARIPPMMLQVAEILRFRLFALANDQNAVSWLSRRATPLDGVVVVMPSHV